MTAKPERLVMTEEAFPDIYPYLTPRDIRLFNSSENRQQRLLQEWKSSKPFLSNIPARELPKHFFPPPKERASVLFYCGWRITYNQLHEVAMKEYPEECGLLMNVLIVGLEPSKNLLPTSNNIKILGKKCFRFYGE
ncbi:hypothetical protein LENED_001242 [Lentinula edodes]|uniref:Uncharacterized protein n=1 Tax=Lentinula edodes TaxID=5353 RepID=A0A1Q3DXN9_LENED|nr:hypothetical protein LENED_001242 [Lentinula edodes]